MEDTILIPKKRLEDLEARVADIEAVLRVVMAVTAVEPPADQLAAGFEAFRDLANGGRRT